MSGGGFEGKSNDIVYSDIVYSDIVYSDIVYSDNAEYNYGSLSELYNNIDLSQYLASGITAIYYYDLSRFECNCCCQQYRINAYWLYCTNTGNQNFYVLYRGKMSQIGLEQQSVVQFSE
jgi:hypothetical protein